MFKKLVPKHELTGAMINGLYIGAKATSKEFGGSRFARFGPYPYQPGHLAEAIRNQYTWRKMMTVYEQLGYYPQHASKLCGGCPFADLCEASPASRASVIQRQYVARSFNFLDF